jgi:hypothetical protein
MANLVVLYAFATPSVSGNTTLVSATVGSRIVVSQVCVITSAANSVKFQSNGSSDISALFPLAANGGFVLPYSELGWMQTNIGESLTCNMTNGSSTGIQIVYCLSTN